VLFSTSLNPIGQKKSKIYKKLTSHHEHLELLGVRVLVLLHLDKMQKQNMWQQECSNKDLPFETPELGVWAIPVLLKHCSCACIAEYYIE
jgi:hypothetical protein